MEPGASGVGQTDLHAADADWPSKTNRRSARNAGDGGCDRRF